MDRIVSMSYNYGVTLVDLDQVALAERFVAKAVNLLRFASHSLKSWLPRIQVRHTTYANASPWLVSAQLNMFCELYACMRAQETYTHVTKVNLERQRQCRVGLGVGPGPGPGSGLGAGRGVTDFSKTFGFSATSVRDTVLIHDQLK